MTTTTRVRNTTARPIHIAWTDRLPPVPSKLRPEHRDELRPYGYGPHLVPRRVDVAPGGLAEVPTDVLDHLRQHDEVTRGWFDAGDLTVEVA